MLQRRQISIKKLKIKQENKIAQKSLSIIDTKSKNFNLLMQVYQKALDEMYNELSILKNKINEIYGYEVINNITKRIKTPDSIINKMYKKHYELNFKNLIENINDIAGIRVICSDKSDIYTIVDYISQMNNIDILKVKDYIKKPKKSGYSAYHIIAQTTVQIEEKFVPIKVEIQIRTMAMDFWAINEHKIKYKTDKKLSVWDSRRLAIYAKLLMFLESKIMKLHQKQNACYK